MVKFNKLLGYVVTTVFLFTAGVAAADQYYTSSGGYGQPGGLGYIKDLNSTGEILLENVGRADTAIGSDGWARLLVMGNSSYGDNAGIKIYNPYRGGDSWTITPEQEANLTGAEITEGWDDNKESNPRGMEILGNYLYVAYFANDIGFNGSIDGSTRIVRYDMSNGFKKTNQYIFKPEDKDPDAAANAMDVFAYNGKIYGIYTGYSKKNAADSMWYGVYGPYDSYVVELYPDLTPTGRELIVPSRALYLGMLAGASCHWRSGNLLYLAAAGVPESLAMYDIKMAESNIEDSAISIVNLDSMSLEAVLSGRNLDETWETPFKGITATSDGDVYFFACDNPMYSGTDKQFVYKTTVNDIKKIQTLTADAPQSMDSLAQQGFVTKIWEGEWSGTFSCNPEINYDKSTDCIWWNPGTGGLYRYKANGSQEPVLIGQDQMGEVGSIFVAYNAQIPSITTEQLGEAVVAEAYSFTLTASGTRPFTWSVKSGELPDGLSLDADTGVISGIPEASGDYTFVVQVENMTDSATKEFSITVTDDRVAPTITLEALPEGTAGTEYHAQLTADGSAPFTWLLVDDSTLPEGLVLDETTGMISGTPNTAGVSVISVTVRNAIGEDSREFTINIKQPSAVPDGGGSGSGGSSGCNTGAGILSLLALVPIAVFGRKNR